MSVSTLGYLTFSTLDIPAWKAFGTQILGLMLNEDISNAGTLFFRMDDHPSRLVIQKSERDRLAAVGWEIFDKAGYETSINRLRAAGAIVARATKLAPQHAMSRSMR